MNLDDLVKKITSLEDENRSAAKTLAGLYAKINKIEDSNASFLETARDMRKEVERLGGIVSRLGQFDTSLTQTRVEFSKKIAEMDAKQKLADVSLEKVRKENQDAIQNLLASNKEMLTTGLDKKMKVFFDEDSRLVNKVMEMDASFESNLKRDQSLQKTAMTYIEETDRISKKMENAQIEFVNIKKKLDEMVQKINLNADELRKNESRINELASTENVRKLDQSKFIDQQSLQQMDRDRTWKEWMRQFGESNQQASLQLQELTLQSRELRRSRDAFNEITQRFDRRMNELTEMYRILEERLRQDWATFKGDEEKRWSNYSLIFGEKQGDFLGQFQDSRNRLTVLEDRTKEIQDVFLMVSTELQKGMQGLMQMVNNWIVTFDDIRNASQTGKTE
jgi:chromosome segregation ATPase